MTITSSRDNAQCTEDKSALWVTKIDSFHMPRFVRKSADKHGEKS